jgi:hypothetical protein
MIQDVDAVLKQLLVRELRTKKNQVDFEIEFHQPRREWSARLNRPTLNLFMHDLHENNTLRQHEWHVTRQPDGKTTKQRSPIRLDLHYIVTAWATEPEDEHELLTRAVWAFYRNPLLPDDLLPERLKRHQLVPIPVRVAEQDALRNAADLWGVLDNELRPALSLTITVSVNPYEAVEGAPQVRTRRLQFGQAGRLNAKLGLENNEPADKLWLVAGTVRSRAPLDASVTVKLLERGLVIPVLQPEGKFLISGLQPGVYTLEVAAPGRPARRRKITVPCTKDDNYDISL